MGLQDKMDILKLVEILQKCWDKNSSYSPDDWNQNNPARGQCAVSSLIVQDYCGGDIARFEVVNGNATESHYANIIGGALVDVTRSQFPASAVFRENSPDLTGYKNIRQKMLSSTDTRQRYEYLKKKVSELINE